jgi:hypothetical protein
MNAAEFNTEMGKLIERAFSEGIARRKMSPLELIGTLECQKADCLRNFQDLARLAQSREQRIVTPGTIPFPPRPGT